SHPSGTSMSACGTFSFLNASRVNCCSFHSSKSSSSNSTSSGTSGLSCSVASSSLHAQSINASASPEAIHNFLILSLLFSNDNLKKGDVRISFYDKLSQKMTVFHHFCNNCNRDFLTDSDHPYNVLKYDKTVRIM